MRRALAALAGAFLALPAAAAPSLEVAVEPATATVGDLVSVTLTLRGAPDDPARIPRFPDWSHGWGALEVREASPPERTAAPEGPVWTQRLVLTAFRTGTLKLPPVAVAIPGEPPIGVAAPADLALEIRSVLPEDPTEWERQPPAPPVPLAVPVAFWWLASALALGALGAAFAAARRARRRTTLRSSTLSPWEELTGTIGALDPADARAADAALSLALRRYLGRSFAMPAAQSSTSELARRLGRHGLPPELVRRIVKLLRDVDQVKFALATASGDRVALRRNEVREIARAIEQHLHPPVTEAAA